MIGKIEMSHYYFEDDQVIGGLFEESHEQVLCDSGEHSLPCPGCLRPGMLTQRDQLLGYLCADCEGQSDEDYDCKELEL